MRVAYITLSREGALLIPQLRREFGEIDCYLHEAVAALASARSFAHITELTHEIFSRYEALIYAAPCGVIVRALAGCVVSKLTDPAVVVLDVGARWTVSLLSGHEGGANDLAIRIGNLFDAEPIVTTTTEAVKDLIVGIGCRRGTASNSIIDAVEQALTSIDMPITHVRLLASASVKHDEAGLLEAANQLEIPLRFISMEQIRQCPYVTAQSEFVQKSVGVPAVAEPVALLAGRRTSLILPKTIYNSVTIAIAKESCTSLE
jgi:cobalt-precorrin 5A hydrolase